MRPNITHVNDFSGKLFILEGADGAGKSSQAKQLKKILKDEGLSVVISGWKTAPIIGEFLKSNEMMKAEMIITPEANLFLQAADLLYRIEREVIPALMAGKVVILDRGVETLIVRGMMIGMSEMQLKTGLLWFRNSVYKELFDRAEMIFIDTSLDISMERLKERAEENKHEEGGTLLSMHRINNLVYSMKGDPLTKADKRRMMIATQKQVIESYRAVCTPVARLTINGDLDKKDITASIFAAISDSLMPVVEKRKQEMV